MENGKRKRGRLLRWAAAVLVLLGLLWFRLRSPAAETVLRAVYGEEAAEAFARPR